MNQPNVIVSTKKLYFPEQRQKKAGLFFIHVLPSRPPYPRHGASVDATTGGMSDTPSGIHLVSNAIQVMTAETPHNEHIDAQFVLDDFAP